MQFEQEIESIMALVLAHAEGFTPYYDAPPKDLSSPALYFPPPEIESRGDTMSTYTLQYTWHIKLYHSNAHVAYALGLSVLKALQNNKKLVPLFDGEGVYTGHGFKLKDPQLKAMEDTPEIIQLILSWDSIKPYDNETAEKMKVYDLYIYNKNRS